MFKTLLIFLTLATTIIQIPETYAAQQQESPRVWGDTGSPFVRKVLMALEYKNIPYENIQTLPVKVLKMLNQEVPKEFETISPLGKIPAYQEGSFSVVDSSVILAYLEKAYGQQPLYPSDPKQLAQVLWLEEYADTVVTDVLHKKVFFELVNKPKVNLPTNTDTVKQALEKEVPSILAYLESQLNGPYAGNYLVGDHFTVADISVVTHFIGFELIANQTVDAERYPALNAYLQRLYVEPAVAKIIASVK